MDPISTATLIISGLNIILIPIVIKSFDLIKYCASHIKQSSCGCLKISMNNHEKCKEIEQDEETLKLKPK